MNELHLLSPELLLFKHEKVKQLGYHAFGPLKTIHFDSLDMDSIEKHVFSKNQKHGTDN